MVTVLLNSCSKCGGDLRLDEDDWRCWQCAETHFSLEKAAHILDMAKDVPNSTPEVDSPGATRRAGRAYGSAGDHNRTIERRNLAEARFWERNREVIRLLDEGKPIREIAEKDGRTERRLLKVIQQAEELLALKDV